MSKRKISTKSSNAGTGKKLRLTKKQTALKDEDPNEFESEDIKIDNELMPAWQDHELLIERHGLTAEVAKSIVALFRSGNEIPFIARYRKNETKNMAPEELRDVKETYLDINALKLKMNSALKMLSKAGVLDDALKYRVLSVRDMEELEHLYAPYKPGSKGTLAERAKELGLEAPAQDLLNNRSIILESYINTSNPELSTTEKIRNGIVHILAAIISRDSDVLAFIRKLKSEVNFGIETKKASTKKASENTSKPSTAKNKINTSKPIDESKYSNYFDFSASVKYIKPHQVLAINRAETQKVLNVKIVVPDYFFHKFSQFCSNKWLNNVFDGDKREIITTAIKDAYTRLIQPLVIRQIRTDLKLKAEKASYEVFTTNLKHLLLTPPLKGKCILGIDPGYTNGCKLAVVSVTGALLSYDTIYPHKSMKDKCKSADVLKSLLQKHDCSLIGLGNGTACRKTEEWLTELISSDFFRPLDVTYTIVNEDGASIYSCSPEAKQEFPDLDPNIISAVSLARRIQDPLAELVKVDPHHLGVGMYQHDMRKKNLEVLLKEVVSECVSFVGVDLNTASQCLLRQIAGLTNLRATEIIKYRDQHGPFTNRKELLKVKGVGAKVFEQCAGFLRISPTNPDEAVTFYKRKGTTRLDATEIHPESYETTEKLLKKFKLSIADIGTEPFINNIICIKSTCSFDNLSAELDVPVETIAQIFESLTKPINFDLRSVQSHVPLFKKGLADINELTVGSVLTGRVNNVTHFGSFIDIGVGCNGLIHRSKQNGLDLQTGDKVEVKVLNIELERKRIGLECLTKL